MSDANLQNLADEGDRPSITEVNGTVARFEMAYPLEERERWAFRPAVAVARPVSPVVYVLARRHGDRRPRASLVEQLGALRCGWSSAIAMASRRRCSRSSCSRAASDARPNVHARHHRPARRHRSALPPPARSPARAALGMGGGSPRDRSTEGWRDARALDGALREAPDASRASADLPTSSSTRRAQHGIVVTRLE